MRTAPYYLSIFIFLCGGTFSRADQPIMNMMPRWDNGYGFQILSENLHRKDLKQGDTVIASNFNESIHRLRLQGVYTWDRSIRLTFKLPYIVEARRETLGSADEKIVEHYSGFGDLTLALPLKKYFNLEQRSGSWTLAPQLRVPLGSKTEKYEAADRQWAAGLSLGYETEVYRWFFATSINTWVFENSEPFELNASIDLRIKIRDDIELLWESDFHWDDAGAAALAAGPAIYWRIADQIHSRLEWKHDFISRVQREKIGHANGDKISIGIGFVF